jgi:hypothetical protein
LLNRDRRWPLAFLFQILPAFFMLSIKYLHAICATALVATASAQSSDDCLLPQSFTGQGNFAFDNSHATTGLEGQAQAICLSFGTSGISNDIWFLWTADATGVATLKTCFGLGLDTKIAAYAGAVCPHPTSGIAALACNDDTCGLESEITFAVTSGSIYLLQIGNFPGASGGPGQYDLAIAGPLEPGTPFCFGDGSGGPACPCAALSSSGHGCPNASNSTGAKLTGSGTATVGADTLELSAIGMTAGQPWLVFQGSIPLSGGGGVLFGNGKRCAGGDVKRVKVGTATPGRTASTSPPTGGPPAVPLSTLGAISPGDLVHYQFWYRDPFSTCGSVFNLSNAYSVQW